MQLTDIQKEILEHPARFKVVVAGRRAGKSYASIASLAKHARFPNKRCLYIAPTYRMAKQIIWDDLKGFLSDVNWVRKINESELTITLVNGSTIMLRSADNPDSIRGIGVDHLVIDEAADIPRLEDTWRAVIRPTLSDRSGSALIVGTPKGRNFYYDLYNDAKHQPDWHSWQFTTAQGGIVSQAELDQAKRDLDDRTYRQEFEATFVEFTGQIYYAFGDHNIQSMAVPVDQRVPLHVGIDFNYSPLCAVIAWQHGAGIHIFDEIEIFGSDTQSVAQEIQRRYPSRTYFAYPDASGAQKRTSAGGLTDHIILHNAGFKLRVGNTNPAVKDRISAVNSALKAGNAKPKLTVDPACTRVINSMRKHCYAEGTRQPEKDSGYDHFNDAVGYMINQLYPLTLDLPTSTNRVYRRF